MSRAEFMQQLERLLWDIPKNDRLDAIEYYNNYFDEAGLENEEQVIRELGSPQKVATIIKEGVHTSGSQQVKEEAGYDEPKQKKNMHWPVIIILLVFASPILLGVGVGLLGGIVGVFGAMFGIVVACLVCGAAFLVAGIVCSVVGIARVGFSPVEGLITIGVGSLSLAFGILFILLFVWCAFKWIPALIRGTVNICKRLFCREERRSEV